MTINEKKKIVYKEKTTAYLDDKQMVDTTVDKLCCGNSNTFMSVYLFIKIHKELTLDEFKRVNIKKLLYSTTTSEGPINFIVPIEECFYEGRFIFSLEMEAKELIRWII